MAKDIFVVGAALLQDDKVLVSRRNSDRILGDLWEFPGGKIEPNETPQQALKRELEEEFDDEITVGPQVTDTYAYEYEFGRRIIIGILDGNMLNNCHDIHLPFLSLHLSSDEAL